MLKGKTKIYPHPHCRTLYMSIPTQIASDSTFPFNRNDDVTVEIDPKNKRLLIYKEKEN